MSPSNMCLELASQEGSLRAFKKAITKLPKAPAPAPRQAPTPAPRRTYSAVTKEVIKKAASRPALIQVVLTPAIATSDPVSQVKDAVNPGD